MDRLNVLNSPGSTPQAHDRPRPRLGVFKFASCDGCQLSLLDCEDELMTVAARVEIAFFREATRRPLEGEFDLALVEGSISTPEQEDEIRDIRRRSRLLVTLGACASHGGIQGLRNFGAIDAGRALAIVYAEPQYVATLERSRPASDYVAVDAELPGCPVSKRQLLGAIAQMLAGSRPRVDAQALCLDCKRRGLVCVLVAQGAPCMGPVTTAGCGVLCPGYDRPCYSCFGPVAQPNTAALAARFAELGLAPAEIRRLFHAYYANESHFQEEGNRHAEQPAG
jgi:coenzyme F420-reducing hydrogenase gamma subunit